MTVLEHLEIRAEKSEKGLNNFFKLDKKIFDFMYSKLNDLDKKHIDKLRLEKRKI